MNFEYSTRENGPVITLALKGDLMERNQAEPLLSQHQQFLQAGSRSFIINLKELRYMNSSGINVLINILTRSRNMGGEVVVTQLSDKAKQLLVVTKLNTVFNVTETEEEALAVFSNNI
jgi:anti-sigma B factor antagonist